MNIMQIYEDKKEVNRQLKVFINKKLIRKHTSRGLVSAHLNKVKHNLEFYELNKDNSSFNDWLIVILYYSLYHCALALICNKDYISKNHTATLLFLIKYYGLSKEEVELLTDLFVSKEDAEFYINIKSARHSANYSTSVLFDDNLVKEYRLKVLDFFRKVVEILP